MNESIRASDIACSLTDEAFKERRAVVRRSLLPHLVAKKRTEGGLRLCFPNTMQLRSHVEAFVELERQCCGFLTFSLAPREDRLVLSIDGPSEAQATLDLLADAIGGP